MVRSLFGGDPRVSHYSANVPYKTHSDEPEREAAERRKRDRQALRDAGIKERYFQYRNDDAKGKAKAKKLAEAEAKRITKLTGVAVTVNEGCFL